MKMRRTLFACTMFFWGIQSATSASGELAIIVHASNPSAEISLEEVASIFLGKSRRLPDGTKVIPIDQLEGEGVRVIARDVPTAAPVRLGERERG